METKRKQMLIHNDFNTNILLHKIKQHFDLIYFGIYLLKIADSMWVRVAFPKVHAWIHVTKLAYMLVYLL